MAETFKLNDIVIMKKKHACGTNKWLIIRMGVDIKIKCLNCNREVMLDRLEFSRKLKKVVGGNFTNINCSNYCFKWFFTHIRNTCYL